MAENVMYKMNTTTWDIWASIFGAVIIFIGLAFFFAQPTVSVFGKNVAISHAMIILGTLIGAMIWMLVEMVTKPRQRFWDLLFRFFGSFIVGFFIGMFFAYYLMWGQYVLIPASNGNWLALAELILTFLFFVALVINAVYTHNKTFNKNHLKKKASA